MCVLSSFTPDNECPRGLHSHAARQPGTACWGPAHSWNTRHCCLCGVSPACMLKPGWIQFYLLWKPIRGERPRCLSSSVPQADVFSRQQIFVIFLHLGFDSQVIIHAYRKVGLLSNSAEIRSPGTQHAGAGEALACQ